MTSILAHTYDSLPQLGVLVKLSDSSDNHNHDQLSLSFRLRGSWLIGQSVEDRHEKYRQLRDLYDYRSQVAHGGM